MLTENTSRTGLPTEHGLSLFIETPAHRILFDTGQSGLFAENAQRLGVDLRSVDIAIISHGHYDHGGGLRKFLQINQTAPVYISRHAFEPHFNSEGKEIGLDPTLQGNSRLIFTGERMEIEPGMTLYSCNDRERAFDLNTSGLFAEIDSGRREEDFRHEQYLLMEAGGRGEAHGSEAPSMPEAGGHDEALGSEVPSMPETGGRRILVSGCSHKGIRDIVRWFHPDVLIGGFHFTKLPLDETLRAYARDLDAMPTAYYTCHCTGTEQYAFMSAEMQNLHYISAGDTIEV